MNANISLKAMKDQVKLLPYQQRNTSGSIGCWEQSPWIESTKRLTIQAEARIYYQQSLAHRFHGGYIHAERKYVRLESSQS